MKVAKFLYFAAPFLIGAGILIALHPTLTRTMGATSVAAGAKVSEKTASLTSTKAILAAEKLDKSPIATRPGSTVVKAPASNEPAYLNDPDYLRKLEKEELAKPYMGTLDGLLDCTSPISIACGGSYSGTNSGFPSNVTYYSCSGWTESGPEVLFELTITSPKIIVAALSGLTGDLDVFILSTCDEAQCIAYGDNSATTTCKTAGTYYIVVDGYYGAISPFTLTVSCIPCGGVANKTTITRTFKNTSAVAANDFHGKVLGSGDGSIDNASAYLKKHPPPNEQAFPDKVFDPPVKEFDWTADECLKKIPKDSTMEVNVSGTRPELESAGASGCYFTLNGTRLATESVANEKKIVPGGGHYGRDCGGGSVEFCNAFYSETLLLTGVEVRVDNTGDPGEIGPYIPDGTLVPGIPSSFSLASGETLSFPYMATNPLLAVSMSDTAALASLPDDCYYELMAASPVAMMVPDNVTISYNSGTGNVEIHWLDVGEGLSYKIYRATDDPSGPFTLIGTVPAGVQFYADFAGGNMKAFYYVTGSCD